MKLRYLLLLKDLLQGEVFSYYCDDTRLMRYPNFYLIEGHIAFSQLNMNSLYISFDQTYCDNLEPLLR